MSHRCVSVHWGRVWLVLGPFRVGVSLGPGPLGDGGYTREYWVGIPERWGWVYQGAGIQEGMGWGYQVYSPQCCM